MTGTDPDGLFVCPRHPGGLRLTPGACAASWHRRQGQADRFHPCHGCAIGAAHARAPAPEPAPARACAFCERPSGHRLIFGVLCASCYNRTREVAVGADRRGRVPQHRARLRLFALEVEIANPPPDGSRPEP